jgi:hypothetical protein
LKAQNIHVVWVPQKVQNLCIESIKYESFGLKQGKMIVEDERERERERVGTE